MTNKKQRLELTWIGKDEELKLEPRILIEDPSKSYGDKSSPRICSFMGTILLALKGVRAGLRWSYKMYLRRPTIQYRSCFRSL